MISNQIGIIIFNALIFLFDMKISIFSVVLLLLQFDRFASAFELASPRNLFADLLGKRSITKDSFVIEKLKQDLRQECQRKPSDRATIEDIIHDLSLRTPVRATASSILLQKRWKLVYTTEKEINFFLENGLANEIYQTIDGENLANAIPFVRGGSFGVKGKLSIPDRENGVRTNFIFETASLDLGWTKLNFPPIGKGWFDTVYLDDTLRIDLNSRNDILICEQA